MAEEAISAIRTVFAFGGQDKEQQRYKRMLKPAMKAGFKRNAITAIGNSINWGVLYASFALGLWYGVKLVLNPEENYSIGDVIIVFWAIAGTGYNIGYYSNIDCFILCYFNHISTDMLLHTTNHYK